MDKTGIMQWLITMGHENDVDRIIDNVVKCADTCIDKYGLKKYNNNYNDLSDVFGLVFSYVKIDIAPDNYSTMQDIADYNTLMEVSSDLPLIVYRYVKERFSYVSCHNEDFKYCEHFIENYKNVHSFRR